MRRRWPAAFGGLRTRLVLALVLTAVVTLGVAALALLEPLERRLRDQETSRLLGAAQAAALSIDGLPTPLALDARSLRRPLAVLRRRTAAEATVVNRRGRVLASTDRDPEEQLVLARRVAVGAPGRQFVRGTGDAAEAVVVLPLSPAGPRLALVAVRSLTTVNATATAERQAFLIAAAAGLLTAVALGLLLAERLARRLRALRTATTRLVELGPAVELAPDDRADEVGDLSRAFSQVQHALREQEQARRTFVATASHELRTPLTSLELMLDAAADELDPRRPEPAAALDQVRRAQGQAARLSALAAQLLDLSRIDAGVPLRSELVDLREVCRAVRAEFAGRAAERGVVLAEVEGPRGWAHGDPDAVARIVRILLDNALRASPPGGCVSVQVATDGSIRVSDEGPGVPVEHAERIFARFERGEDEGAGFGLGLAIGRELAADMGGGLALLPSEPGATFALTVPAAAPPPELT